MRYVDTKELEKLGILVKEEGVYVTNAEHVDSLNAASLEHELLRLGILEAPYKEIVKLYKQNLKEPVKVADRLVEYAPEKNDYIRVTVSIDALEAYLDVTFPSVDDEEITERDIIHRILKAGVVYNIDYEKIKQIVENRIFVEKEVIARGKEPYIGEEAQIVLEVDTEISSEPLIKEDGSVDFHQIGLLKTVEKDQLLAEKIPASKGQDGINVLGEVIDSTGKNKPLPQGENTYISDDCLSLYAAVSGRIVYKKKKLSVENKLTIRGDVDYSTGNIEFTGDIDITGDVLTGFKVKTEGDIRIRGVVEGAEIISTKGSIIIGRGVVGQEKARILAAKNIFAEFINESTVEAGHNVTVSEYIMNSIVSADNEIQATKGRGSIIGGKLFAEKAIEAKVIGSASYLRTEVKVGGRVSGDLYKKMLIIEHNEEVLEKTAKNLLKEIEFIELLKRKLPKFPKSKQDELTELLIKLRKVENRKGEVEKQKKELIKEFRIIVSEKEKKISANTIYSNVILSIDQNKMLTEYIYKMCMVYSRDGQMKINFRSREA
ncbi:hypothetical protein AMJ80_05040 [bacterium SM23_31]|nr:MAG: hypothetical protein AMJ80_05040 [bacterium SM23_31]